MRHRSLHGHNTDIDFHEDPRGCTDTHRTWFHEEWAGGTGRRDVVVVMKNPSWPDKDKVCLAEARKMATDCWFSNLYVGKLFGLRARHPRALNAVSYDDAVTEGNDTLLELMAAEVDLIVGASGDANGINPARYRHRVLEVVELLGRERFRSFGTTGSGHPRHCYNWRFGRRPFADWDLSEVHWRAAKRQSRRQAAEDEWARVHPCELAQAR